MTEAEAAFHGMPCWYELASAETGAAKTFYAALFGWTWADMPMGPDAIYSIARAGAENTAGLMATVPGQPAGWAIYFAVTSCDATVAEAEGLGAKVLVPPTEIPGTGRFAVMLDPLGAGFSILQPLDGAAGGAFDQQKAGHGNWNELHTSDPKAALAFYGQIFGWTETRAVPMGPDLTYHVFAAGGLDIGGACKMGDCPRWRPYFGIASVGDAVASVPAAGGQVLHGPDEVPGGAFTLQIKDAQGLELALVGPG